MHVRTRSKLIERSLFVIIHLLQGAMLAFLFFYGVWRDDFLKKSQILEENNSFYFITFIVLCYYGSINLKRQSEHSGFCPESLYGVCGDDFYKKSHILGKKIHYIYYI